MKRILVIVAIGAVIAGALVWSYLRNHGEADREATAEQETRANPRVATQNGEHVVRLDAATQKQSGLEVAKPEQARFPEQLRAYGSIVDVRPLVELGRSYAGAKSRHQAALAKLQASRSAFERAKALHADEQNVSTAQLQAAEATYRADEAASVAADVEVKTSLAAAEHVWGPVLGRAIAQTSGMFERLSSRTDVLVQITLPAGAVIAQPPEVAYVESPGGGMAKLRFVSRATRTDPGIQGLSFYYSGPADTGLVSGMNVLAYLPSGAAVEGKLVPASAVVWWQGRAWVFLRRDAQTFARQAIATDRPSQHGGYIVQGLPNEAEVAVRGAQMLLSEELRAAAVSGAEEIR